VDRPTANQEMNTTLADAVIRVFTGQFSDPDLEGFFPSVPKIPTKRAYAQIAKSAKLEAPDVRDWDKEIGFGAGRSYSWNGPHFMSLSRLGG